MNELRFFAYGLPKPQGSKTPGMTKDGRLYVRENNTQSHKNWREAVRLGAVAAMGEQQWVTLQNTAVDVNLAFRFEARKSENDLDDEPKISAPDLDKLIRSVLDSLTDAHVWDDDSRVARIRAVKHYVTDASRKGVVVKVASLKGANNGTV